MAFYFRFKSFFYLSIPSFFLLTSCMTSSRQEQLQVSLSQLQDQVSLLQTKLNSRDQQLNNAEKASQESESNFQNLQDQIRLTQGVIDELNAKIKHLESAASNVAPVEKNVAMDVTALPEWIQLKQIISRFNLSMNPIENTARFGKLSTVKNEADVHKVLKTIFDKGDFEGVIRVSNIILNGKDATKSMLTAALEYRGEAHFQLQQYRLAAIDLSDFIYSSSSSSARYARALLLNGDSYVYLKNKSIAQSYYEECVKLFAETPEGKAAATRLDSLKVQLNGN